MVNWAYLLGNQIKYFVALNELVFLLPSNTHTKKTEEKNAEQDNAGDEPKTSVGSE
jgi:hypothetical protein